MKDVQLELMVESQEIYEEIDTRNRRLLEEGGMEFIKFSPADGEWYVDLAYRVEWEKQLERWPEVASKLKELLSE